MTIERGETLNGYLTGLRLGSGLSVEVVCQRTKIQARFVAALEAGRWGEVPSNTHVRAFSVAIAKACGADGTR
ncbi:MAG: helix-turn-helix domain-containing protein, partial [bacterium]